MLNYFYLINNKNNMKKIGSPILLNSYKQQEIFVLDWKDGQWIRTHTSVAKYHRFLLIIPDCVI